LNIKIESIGELDMGLKTMKESGVGMETIGEMDANIELLENK